MVTWFACDLSDAMRIVFATARAYVIEGVDGEREGEEEDEDEEDEDEEEEDLMDGVEAFCKVVVVNSCVLDV